MTTPTIDSLSTFKTQSVGDGVTTAIPITWSFFKRSDNTHEISVIKLNTSTGVTTNLVEDTDYTVALTSANPGPGTLTLTTAHTASETITVIPAVDVYQPISLPTSGALDTTDISSMVNRNLLILKQFQVELNNAISVAQTSTNTDFEVPIMVAADINKIVTVNATYDGFTYVSVDELVSLSSFNISVLTTSANIYSTDPIAIYDTSGATQVKYAFDDLDVVTSTDTAADSIQLKRGSDSKMVTCTLDNLGIGSSDVDGDVLQIQRVTKSDTQDISCTAPSPTAHDFQDISGLSIAFTPENVNSKIIVGGWVNIGCSTTRNAAVRILNGGASQSTATNHEGPFTEVQGKVIDNLGTGVMTTVPIFAIFDSGSTNARNIKVQAGSISSVTLKINRTNADTDADEYFRGSCHLWAMEVMDVKDVATKYGSLFSSIDRGGPRSVSLNNTPVPRVLASGVNVTPTTSTSHNLIIGSIAKSSSTVTSTQTLTKDGSTAFAPTTPSNRLPGTIFGAGYNTNQFALVDSLSDDDPVNYSLLIAAGCGLTTGTLYYNTFEASTSLSSKGSAVGTSGIYVLNFNTTVTGTPYKQIQTTTLSGTSSGSATGSTFYDPSLSVTITPTSASSYLMGVLTVCTGQDFVSGTGDIAIKLQRDSSDVLAGDAASNRTPVASSAYNPADTFMSSHTLIFMLPATAATATTIDTHITHNYSSSANVYVNRSHTDSDSTTYKRGVSQLSIIEILPN